MHHRDDEGQRGGIHCGQAQAAGRWMASGVGWGCGRGGALKGVCVSAAEVVNAGELWWVRACGKGARSRQGPRPGRRKVLSALPTARRSGSTARMAGQAPVFTNTVASSVSRQVLLLVLGSAMAARAGGGRRERHAAVRRTRQRRPCAPLHDVAGGQPRKRAQGSVRKQGPRSPGPWTLPPSPTPVLPRRSPASSTGTSLATSGLRMTEPTSFRAVRAAEATLGCGSASTSPSRGTTTGRHEPSCLGAQCAMAPSSCRQRAWKREGRAWVRATCASAWRTARPETKPGWQHVSRWLDPTHGCSLSERVRSSDRCLPARPPTWMLPCLVRQALSSTPLSSAGSTSFTPWPDSWPMMARAAPSAASRTCSTHDGRQAAGPAAIEEDWSATGLHTAVVAGKMLHSRRSSGEGKECRCGV